MATTFSSSSCWRPGNPGWAREAASPVIFAGIFAERQESRQPLFWRLPRQQPVFVRPARHANALNVKQMLLADMFGECGVKRDHVFGPAQPGPRSQHVRRIIGQRPDQSDVLNALGKRQYGLSGAGSFFKSTSDRSAAVRASETLSGRSIASASCASSA